MSLRSRQSGLTLFELVIVLAILAAIAASAAIAAERVLSRRRLEITQQTLETFRRSTLGSYGLAETISTPAVDGNPTHLQGFVADMGRMPIAVGTDPTTQLAELWSNPGGMAAYGRKVAPGDPEVFLNCGWRGPYIDLPVGAAQLTDGWGRPMVVLSRDGSGAPQAASAGEAIFGITSLGSDGELGVTTAELPLAEDLTLWLGDDVTSPLASDVTVTVFQHDGSGGKAAPSGEGTLLVRLYLPDASSGNVAALQSDPIDAPFSTPPNFTFANVPIGPKVIRAYWVGEDSTEYSSPPESIEIFRGGQTAWELVLPAEGS